MAKTYVSTKRWFFLRLGPVAALFLCTTVIAAALEPPETIDLPQAIAHALTQNKELARAAFSVPASVLEGDRAEGDFRLSVRPRVAVDYSGGDVSPGYGLALSRKLHLGTKLVMAGDVIAESRDRGIIKVQLEQPIFKNFGPLIQDEPMAQAKSSVRRARRRLEIQKGDLTVDVVRAYEDILRLKHQVGSDEESFRRMESLYLLTEAKEGLNRTTRNDTLRVDFLRGQALFRLEADKERLSSTQREFAELLGYPPETVFALQPTPALEIDVPEPQEAVRIALSNRLEYAQALGDREDADRGVRIGRRRLLPDLKLLASHQWVGDVSSAPDLHERTWFMGAAVSTDLNLAGERASYGRARIDQASAGETASILERSIARQTLSRMQSYRRARAEAEIARRNFELSKARVSAARELFKLGRGDSFSVAEAEVAYLQAESQLISGRADASISGYQLSHALGMLTEVPEDLKPQRLEP